MLGHWKDLASSPAYCSLLPILIRDLGPKPFRSLDIEGRENRKWFLLEQRRNNHSLD